MDKTEKPYTRIASFTPMNEFRLILIKAFVQNIFLIISIERCPCGFGYNVLIPLCHEKYINDVHEEMGSCYEMTDIDHDHRAYFP